MMRPARKFLEFLEQDISLVFFIKTWSNWTTNNIARLIKPHQDSLSLIESH